MKSYLIFLIVILIGITSQNLDSWDDNWSNDTFNTSSDSNLSLDSLLSGGNIETQTSNNWSNNNISMNWSNTDSSSNDQNWLNSGTNNTSLNDTNWTTTSNNASQSDLQWTDIMSTTNDTYQKTDQGQTTQTETYSTQQVYYDKPQITQVQQLVSKPVIKKKVISQPIITKKIVQQPIIKQRIVQTPIIRKKVVSRPVYTEQQNLQPIVDNRTTFRNVPINVPGKTTIRETYYQPTVLTKDVQLQLNRGQTQVNDLPVQTRPTQYTQQVINKVVQAPAKEIYTQPIYQKQIVNNTERVNFVKSNPIYQARQPIVRQPVVQERTRYETITRPGREIYNNTYIQPVVQRENVNVQFNRLPDRNVYLDSIVAPTQYNKRTRTQVINVPGNQVITQPIIQRNIHRHDVHHVQQPVVQRVPVHRPYPVPTPVIRKVPIIRRIPVPVLRKRNQGMKIINLNKVTINGGDDSYETSSDSDQWDHGYDDYNGWIETTNNYNSYNKILQQQKAARMKPFSYKNASNQYNNYGNRNNGYNRDSYYNGYNRGNSYNNYGGYSQQNGADLMFGRSKYQRNKGYLTSENSWGNRYGHSHNNNYGHNHSLWRYNPYHNYY